jgi:hypothetical protein
VTEQEVDELALRRLLKQTILLSELLALMFKTVFTGTLLTIAVRLATLAAGIDETVAVNVTLDEPLGIVRLAGTDTAGLSDETDT